VSELWMLPFSLTIRACTQWRQLMSLLNAALISSKTPGTCKPFNLHFTCHLRRPSEDISSIFWDIDL
ncbi:hypothetical protein AB1N83_012051, partial [Pleurotus pulmonarius]